MSNFENISELKQANKDAGRFFFEAKTMKFFKSKIESGLLKGRVSGQYFITSEAGFRDEEPRRFTVRQAQSNGDVLTAGEFRKYRTREAAKQAIKLMP